MVNTHTRLFVFLCFGKSPQKSEKSEMFVTKQEPLKAKLSIIMMIPETGSTLSWLLT